MWPWSEKTSLKDALGERKSSSCKHDSVKLVLKMNRRIERKERRMKKHYEKIAKAQTKKHEHDLRALQRECTRGHGSDGSSSEFSSDSSSSGRHTRRRRDPYLADPYRVDPYRADPYLVDPYRADPYRDPYRAKTRSQKYRIVKVTFPIVHVYSGKAATQSTIHYAGRAAIEARAKRVMTDVRRVVDQLDNVAVTFSSSSVVVTARAVGGSTTEIRRAIQTFPVDAIIDGEYRFKPPKESIS